jgi:uncharacterized protein (DUF362 family)
MTVQKITRRRFIGSVSAAAAGYAALGLHPVAKAEITGRSGKEIVSIVRIKDGNIPRAVEEAIDLLGGIKKVTHGKDRIILKPNLVIESPDCTTKLPVIKTLARLMKDAGKEVIIGEGSAAAYNFNVRDNEIFRTKNKEILDDMQQYVFDTLGYSDMAKSLHVPLINLHTGDMAEVALKNGFIDQSVRIHKSLTEVDLVCSVPIMKTHTLATVTLAMKNLIGLYPGSEYYTVRSWLHDRAAESGSPGVAYEVLDINRAVNTGLSVIDASTAMEGDGPTSGTLVDMGLIIAGTSPLATDMVGSSLMGFELNEIPALLLAHQSGMLPMVMDDIEIRGQHIDACKRNFARPTIYQWTDISSVFGAREI